MTGSSTQGDNFVNVVSGVHEAGKGMGWFKEMISWMRFVSVHPIRWIGFLWRKEFLACEDSLLRKRCARCLLGLRIWLVTFAIYIVISIWVVWVWIRLGMS